MSGLLGARAGGLSPSGELASAGILGYNTAPTAPERARLLKEGRGPLDSPRLRAIVDKLRGCLSQLPARLQAVLRLRTGVSGSHALDVRSTAMRLHTSPRRLLAAEIAAVRRLQGVSQTSDCAEAGAQPAVLFASDMFFTGTPLTAEGGVASAFYLRPVPQLETAPRSETQTPPSIATAGPSGLSSPSHSGSNLFLDLVPVFVGLVLVGLLTAESLGANPLRSQRKRRRHG